MILPNKRLILNSIVSELQGQVLETHEGLTRPQQGCKSPKRQCHNGRSTERCPDLSHSVHFIHEQSTLQGHAGSPPDVRLLKKSSGELSMAELTSCIGGCGGSGSCCGIPSPECCYYFVAPLQGLRSLPRDGLHRQMRHFCLSKSTMIAMEYPQASGV